MTIGVTKDMASFVCILLILVVGNAFAIMLLFPLDLPNDEAISWRLPEPGTVRVKRTLSVDAHSPHERYA